MIRAWPRSRGVTQVSLSPAQSFTAGRDLEPRTGGMISIFPLTHPTSQSFRRFQIQNINEMSSITRINRIQAPGAESAAIHW